MTKLSAERRRGKYNAVNRKLLLSPNAGERFGKLVYESDAGHDKWGHRLAQVVCSCGVRKRVVLRSLLSGHSQSCGACIRRFGNRKHGGRRTPEYAVWCDIKRRTSNPKASHWECYGGRGIRMCSRWSDSFEAFLADMGPRPSSKHSIERKDNDGNYEPSNCEWATVDVQSRNRRNNHILDYQGKKWTLLDLSKAVGIHRETIRCRLMRGMSVDAAVSIPVMQTGIRRRLHPPDQVVVDAASEGAERPAAPQNIRIGDAASSQEDLAPSPGVGVVA